VELTSQKTERLDMKKKKYLTSTINFGADGTPSRAIAEKIKNKVGKAGFSKVIQDLLIENFSRKKEFDDVKIANLLFERKMLSQQVQEISKKLQENSDKLEKLGVDVKL